MKERIFCQVHRIVLFLQSTPLIQSLPKKVEGGVLRVRTPSIALPQGKVRTLVEVIEATSLVQVESHVIV